MNVTLNKLKRTVKTSSCLTRQLANHSNGRPRISKRGKNSSCVSRWCQAIWTIGGAGRQLCLYSHFSVSSEDWFQNTCGQDVQVPDFPAHPVVKTRRFQLREHGFELFRSAYTRIFFNTFSAILSIFLHPWLLPTMYHKGNTHSAFWSSLNPGR